MFATVYKFNININITSNVTSSYNCISYIYVLPIILTRFCPCCRTLPLLLIKSLSCPPLLPADDHFYCLPNPFFFLIERGIGTCHLDQDYIVAFSHFAPRPLFQYPALPLLHYFAPPFLCANLPFRQLPPRLAAGYRRPELWSAIQYWVLLS